MELNLQSAGTPAYVAILATAIVNLIVFFAKSVMAKKGKEAIVERERIRLEGDANARLYEFMHQRLDEQNATITRLGEKLDRQADELDEMKLQEESCQRELRSARAQIAGLQQRVMHLEATTLRKEDPDD